MLRIIGGWGNREDSLESCTRRLYESLEFIPAQPDTYGPWGVWQTLADSDQPGHEFVTIDISDWDALAKAITESTERTYDGPKTTPGQNILLIREPRGERPPSSPSRFEYSVRAGYVDKKRPFNHVVLGVDAGTDASVLGRIMSALVVAWDPDRLGVASQEVQRAQAHRTPEAVVGWLTYIKDGVQFDHGAVDEQVTLSGADGGLYITVPGTPADPSMQHIRQVRAALGYPNPA